MTKGLLRALVLAAAALAAGALGGCGAAAAQGPAAEAPGPSPGGAGELVLADFEGSLDEFELSDGMTTAFTAEGVTRGKQALEVTFPPGPYPGMGKPIRGALRDWSGFDCLALSVLNPSKAEVRLSVRIDDSSSKDYGSRFNLDGTFKLPPGERTVEIPVLQMERGGIFYAGINARSVVLLKLFVGDVKEPVKLVFDEIKLVRHPRPKEAWKDVLVTGEGRNWEASDSKAEEAATGVAFSAAGGNYPGISINNLGSLYGWTLMELAYSTDGGVRPMSVKLVAAGGEKITMATGVDREGTVIIPLFVAADIPLGDVKLMQVFFGAGDCPSGFDLLSVRLYRMPEGSSDAARPEATKLVADFTPCVDLARNSMFNAWLWLPQSGGGGRWVKKTVARNETLTRVFDAKDLSGGFTADEAAPTNALRPVEMLKTRTPILTGYFIEHGIWQLCSKRPVFKDGETATAKFELKEVGR